MSPLGTNVPTKAVANGALKLQMKDATFLISRLQVFQVSYIHTRTHIRARESGRTRAWAQANENLSCCRSGECTKPFAQDDAERTIYRSSKYDVWLHPRRPREETPLARSSPR